MNVMRVRLPFSLPVLLSVTMHAALLVVVTWGWEAKPHEPRVYRPQTIVQATLVELEARPAPAPEETSPRVVDLTAQRQAQERAEAERRRQQEAERQRQQQQRERERQAQQERDRQAQAERERREREERERRQREEQQRQAREQERQRQLDESLRRDQERRQAEEHAQISASYTDLIAARIERNWSRPPSARLGMQVTLLIHLVPTGEVVNVQIVQSSGNAAFDRSAEQAVRRVDRFTEVRDMPIEVFERNFRQLTLVFRPEDLRQ